jgi:protein-L-isoaspartate(D-aspartate) O-methyltransferase
MNQIEFMEFRDPAIKRSREATVWLQSRYQGWSGDAERQMRWLMEDIAEDLRNVRYITGRTVPGKKVLDAMRRVHREDFVPFELKRSAYANCALPIGYGQSLNQPNLVALMTDLIDPHPDATVLEIGTGSGYQAALLATLAGRVCSMEILEPLAEQARRKLHGLGYENFEIRTGNGCEGWPEPVQFDGIVVTGAVDHVPAALVDQLKPGGTLVIPVTALHGGQELLEITRDAAGHVTEKAILPVTFPALMGVDMR